MGSITSIGSPTGGYFPRKRKPPAVPPRKKKLPEGKPAEAGQQQSDEVTISPEARLLSAIEGMSSETAKQMLEGDLLRQTLPRMTEEVRYLVLAALERKKLEKPPFEHKPS
ncbi:MAG: hypothetical protein WC840_02370 [Candidatus Peribacteraceae bacterium]